MQDYKIPSWLDSDVIPKNIEPNQHSLIWSKWSELSLVKRSLKSGEPLIHSKFKYAKIIDKDKLINLLKRDFGYTLISKSIKYKDSIEINGAYLVADDGDISLQEYYNEAEGEFNIYSSDENKVINVIKLLNKETQIHNRNKFIHVMISTKEGNILHKIGSANQPLIEDNYEDNVVKDYNYVVDQMNSKNPFGRIVILNGSSGTGKSYMVRGLINSIENALFVIMPPSMLVELSGPQLIPVLSNARGTEEESPGPIVLIVEDADEILQPRGSDNMSHISSLLNFGDGILGSALDIRIITTTNAKKFDIENALLRPGRLCKQIEVGNLTSSTAEKVYERLSGRKMAFSKDISLAEVYEKATIKDGSIKKHDQKIGFSF